MKNLNEFGKRLVTLHTGASGLRCGIHCTASAPKDMADGDGDDMMDFIASDNTVDRYNEVLDQNGWQLDNFRANPVIPDCHDYSSISKILGRATSIGVSNGKLVNRVQFSMDNPMGKMAYKMAKAGFIKSQSVGFIPLDWTNGVGQDQPERTYTKMELLEVSLVVVPANPGATIGLALKSGALERSDLTELADYLKEFCSEKAIPPGSAGASAAGSPDAQLLQLARSLGKTLGRA